MPTQQQRTEETRARLLRAAEDCFSRDGYEATGVAEICQAAGVSKGAFYHHFESKHAIFMALLDQWLGGLDRQMALLRTGQGTIPEEIQSMTALVGGVFQAAENRFPLFLEFWAHSSRDPEMWKATIAPIHHYHDFFAAMIEQGTAEGSLQSADPQTTARVIISLVMGLFIQGLLEPRGADWERVAQEGIRIVLEGLKKR